MHTKKCTYFGNASITSNNPVIYLLTNYGSTFLKKCNRFL